MGVRDGYSDIRGDGGARERDGHSLIPAEATLVVSFPSFCEGMSDKALLGFILSRSSRVCSSW